MALLVAPLFAQQVDWVNNVKNKPFVDVRLYNWAPQTPSGSLIIGSNTVTLSPCPTGYAVGLKVYLSAGTGTAETVTTTGGTCTSGISRGSVIFTAVHTHSGAWTIGPTSFGIQEAVNLSSGGALIKIPAGTWNMYGGVTVAKPLGICIEGSGLLTTIIQWQGPTSGDIFDFDGPNSSGGVGQGHCIGEFQIQTSSSTNTNTGLHVDNQASMYAHNLNTVNIHQGISNTGTVSQRNTFRDIGIFNNTGDGVTLNTGLVSGYFDTVFISCTDVALASNGFHVINDAGSVIQNSYTVGCGNEFLSNPSTGDSTRLMQVNDTYFDCGPGNGLTLNPNSTGSILNMRFVNTTTACAGGSGVFLGPDGTINGVSFIGHSSLVNAQHGYRILGGSGLMFSNSLAMGNSASSPNTYDGFAADATVTAITDLQILGGFYGAYWTNPNYQRYGISLSAGVVNPQITNVQLTLNLTQSLSDASTSTFKVIKDNLGIGVPTIPSAAAIDPGTLDPDTMNLTGTTNVTSILRPWDQRHITFLKADGGSFTILGATLAQGSKVECVYSSGLTTWFCK